MNSSSLRRELLEKLQNTPILPRCPKCKARMKATSDGHKCPKCGFEGSEQEQAPEEVVEKSAESVLLVPTALRPGVTDARRVRKNGETLGTIEQISRKWRAVTKSGLSVGNGLTSADVALRTLLAHLDKTGTSAGAKLGWETRRGRGKGAVAAAERTIQKPSKGMQGQKKISISFTPSGPKDKHKEIKLTVPARITAAIGKGKTFSPPDVKSFEKKHYIPVASLRQEAVAGSAADQINAMVGMQLGRAKAYTARANDPAVTPEQKQVLNWKAGQICKHIQKVLAPARDQSLKANRKPGYAPQAPGI